MSNLKYKLIVFDLDGTLISSHETIYKTTVYTLNELNISNSFNKDEFVGMIGHHFEDIFQSLAVKVPDIENFIKQFKANYFNFIDSTELYSGAIELLQELNSNGIYCSILTTKAQDQADSIVEMFNIRKYLKFVMGRREGIKIKPSGEPLEFIMKELNFTDKETLMVGDTELDIRCAKNAGVDNVAVTFGYRTIEQIRRESPDFIINELLEIRKIVGIEK